MNKEKLCRLIQDNKPEDLLAAMYGYDESDIEYIINNSLIQDTSLRRLNFSNNPLGDLGIYNLACYFENNITLEVVYLCSIISTPEFFAKCMYLAFKNSHVLTELYLMNNGFDDSCAKWIAKLIRENNNLQKIYLQCNKITDIGAKDILEAIKVNNRVEVIKLDGNLISEKKLKLINKKRLKLKI